MSIPYYNEIYAFPGGYSYQFNRTPMKPNHEISPSNTIDTSKSVDIVDSFGKLRYVVSLSSCISAIGIDGTLVDSRVYKTKVS